MTPEPPTGARCFLDANIFVYYFTQNSLFSSACWDLMRRVQRGEIQAYTSPMMISEAMHRIMLSEVQSRFSNTKPLAYVQHHPNIIDQLVNYHAAAAALSGLKIEVLPIDRAIWSAITAVAARHSLLTDDASTVAIMQRDHLEYLITNDDDFDSISGIIPCKPR